MFLVPKRKRREIRLASESVENYLKAIYKLERGGEWVSTSHIAERLHISAPSVSRMLKKLSESRWVQHTPYRGVKLTRGGRRAALRVIRNHRILETYLAQVLGMPWDRVDEEVERLEHVVSDALINRMEEVLGFPDQDPHGSPIPDRKGNMPAPDGSIPLVELEVGDHGTVARIADAPSRALSYLEGRGVIPGARLKLIGREPFAGPLELRIQKHTIYLGQELARRVLVVRAEEE